MHYPRGELYNNPFWFELMYAVIKSDRIINKRYFYNGCNAAAGAWSRNTKHYGLYNSYIINSFIFHAMSFLCVLSILKYFNIKITVLIMSTMGPQLKTNFILYAYIFLSFTLINTFCLHFSRWPMVKDYKFAVCGWCHLKCRRKITTKALKQVVRKRIERNI